MSGLSPDKAEVIVGLAFLVIGGLCVLGVWKLIELVVL